MLERSIRVENVIGLYARPAALLARAACRYDSRITLEGNGRIADGKSLLDILTLGLRCGDHVKITADGQDEEAAMRKLARMIELCHDEAALKR